MTSRPLVIHTMRMWCTMCSQVQVRVIIKQQRTKWFQIWTMLGGAWTSFIQFAVIVVVFYCATVNGQPVMGNGWLSKTQNNINRSPGKERFGSISCLHVGHCSCPSWVSTSLNQPKGAVYTVALCVLGYIECSPISPYMMHSCTLHTLGEVSEVEDIVGLGWCREQVFAHLPIDLHCCINNGLCQSLHFISKISKETPGDHLWIRTCTSHERWHHTDGVYTDVGVSSYLNTLLSVCRRVATSLLTLEIILRLTEDGEERQNMLKCRMNLGVTGLRPPPGGAHAAQMVTSWFVLCVRMEVRNQHKSNS